MAPVLLDATATLVARSTGSEGTGTYGYYDYDPSRAASYIFTVAYVLVLLTNITQYFFYRAWFWWPMMLFSIMELLGFAGRDASIHDLGNRGPFVIQTIFILIAPCVLAASCYMAFGRIVLWVVPQERQHFKSLWLPARFITPIFVSFDVVTIFVQAIGGAIVSTATESSKLNTGKNIILVGLAIQLFTFSWFIVSTVRLVYVHHGIRIGRYLSSSDNTTTSRLPQDTNWPAFLTTVILASLLILVRSVYRFAEYALGRTNVLKDNEVYFYLLDALPIIIAVILFILLHPAQYIPYIGIRRGKNGPRWSKNVNKGLCKKLARGKTPAPLLGKEAGYASEASGQSAMQNLVPRYNGHTRQGVNSSARPDAQSTIGV